MLLYSMKALPKGWHDVSIRTFLSYYTLVSKEWGDAIDLEVNLLACLKDCSLKEIEDMDMADIKKELSSLNWLKDLPQTKIPTHFKCGGHTYKANILFTQQKAAQFMNFSQVCNGTKPEDYIYHTHELIACMCMRKEKGLFFEDGMVKLWRYRYDGYKDNAEVFFDNMSMAQAYPFYVFFCKIIENLSTYTQDYLIKETRKLMMTNRGKLKLLKRILSFKTTGAG